MIAARAFVAEAPELGNHPLRKTAKESACVSISQNLGREDILVGRSAQTQVQDHYLEIARAEVVATEVEKANPCEC